MPDTISIVVNGQQAHVPAGATVAVALATLQQAARTSVSGEPRGPLCAMGICYECRVTIDGTPNRLSCQITCRDGMDLVSG